MSTTFPKCFDTGSPDRSSRVNALLREEPDEEEDEEDKEEEDVPKDKNDEDEEYGGGYSVNEYG